MTDSRNETHNKQILMITSKVGIDALFSTKKWFIEGGITKTNTIPHQWECNLLADGVMRYRNWKPSSIPIMKWYCDLRTDWIDVKRFKCCGCG